MKKYFLLFVLAGTLSAAGQRPSYPDCDRNLRGGLTYISRQSVEMLGNTYFYLGLCNYQIAKLTNDIAKKNEALQFSEQSAKIKSPSQAQAQNNAALIRRARGRLRPESGLELLGTGRRRVRRLPHELLDAVVDAHPVEASRRRLAEAEQAVDDLWNVAGTVTDTVNFSSSDASATLPADAALVSGTNSLSVTLR